MSITTPDDVKALWVGTWLPDTGVADTQVQLFINILEGQAESAIPNFVENVEGGQPSAQTVKAVIASAIIDYVRASLSPYASESQSVDGFTRSVSSGDSYRRKLVLLPDELTTLSPKGTGEGQFWMIQMEKRAGSYPRWETPWYDLKRYQEYWKNEGTPLNLPEV